MSSQSIVYATFDRVPAPKGASTHIRAFIDVLARRFSDVSLVTVAGVASTAMLDLPKVRHVELPAVGKSLIERVLYFRSHLRAWWGTSCPDVAHVRSIFEGYPIAVAKAKMCRKLVFEVNGMPSIELKYHYPRVADDVELMRKLQVQEQRVLDAADLIVTVSEINANHLRDRGVDDARMVVIPNGVNIDMFSYQRPRDLEDRPLQILYSGTLSAWQGVQYAIEALALYCRDAAAELTIVGHGRTGQMKRLEELAYRFGVRDRIRFADTVTQAELATMHHQADVVVVPLVPNDRNLVQGCCPLKVLEAMSSGTPLVASDLPVVSAIARPEQDAILVRPGSAKAIKDGLVRIVSERDATLVRSLSARQRVESNFTWQLAQRRLIEAYEERLGLGHGCIPVVR